jgi:hypothetical protein
MATVNISLPDELKKRLDGSGMNLSAVARECWERELARDELEPGEISVDAWDGDDWIDLRLSGTVIVEGEELRLYLTDEDIVVFVPVDEKEFWTSPRGEVDADDLYNAFGRNAGGYYEAVDALGLKRIVRL